MYLLPFHIARETEINPRIRMRVTCVLNTSISVPLSCLKTAVATPFPANQSPLQKAAGRPLNPNGNIDVLIIGHLEKIANPLPRNPAK
jgi:hypothetical protein